MTSFVRGGFFETATRQSPTPTRSADGPFERLFSQSLPPRWWRGLSSAAGGILVPLGHLGYGDLGSLSTEERLDHGIVSILPGIQTGGNLEFNLARGLNEGGVDMGIEIYEWTTGFPPLLLYHLCALRRNKRVAQELANKICAYQDQYPGRPVHLIGYSGGAGVTVLTLEALPADRKVTSVILLAAAIAPTYDLGAAVSHTERGIWSFHSPWDCLVLGIGTLIFGTIDRRRTIAAGARGFVVDHKTKQPGDDEVGAKLHQQPYVAKMLGSWNSGGHLSCTNRVFGTEWLAPLLKE